MLTAAFGLYKAHHLSGKPVRSLSVRALGLVPADEQLSLFPEEQARRKEHDLEAVLDKVRSKYGYQSIRRGLALLDPKLDLDAKRSCEEPAGHLQMKSVLEE